MSKKHTLLIVGGLLFLFYTTRPDVAGALISLGAAAVLLIALELLERRTRKHVEKVRGASNEELSTWQLARLTSAKDAIERAAWLGTHGRIQLAHQHKRLERTIQAAEAENVRNIIASEEAAQNRSA